MSEWQTEDTAPAGAWVLAYEPSQGVCVAQRDSRGQWFLEAAWNGDLPEEMYRIPTHWMPLPEPPSPANPAAPSLPRS